MNALAKRRAGVALSLVIVAGGCSPYAKAGREYRDRDAGIRAALPEGWLRYTAERRSFVITRDGLRLERITIACVRLGAKYAGTERTLSAGMLPLELAEVAVGLLQSRETIKNLKTDKIELVSVGGSQGYRAEASYVDERGLPMRLRLYGAMIGGHAFEFQFAGAEPVYFDKYAPAFEALVASVTSAR